ncbi:MAG: TRAP transporter substrate-binding protein, partial [Burkholderiaceae bacterium]|nr:TRAP transporter substrate-binding protein [Burkholderiaceae bacterium]
MGSFKEDFKDTAVAVLETAQDQYRDAISFIKETWPLLLLLLVILIGLLAYWNPPPPRHIMMASGIEGGSYEQLASKYVDF